MHLYIGHFWSLCVEEQFYLVWPIVVYQIRRRTSLIWVCLTVVFAEPFFRCYLTDVLSSETLRMELLYRSAPTRVDGLLVGGLIALWLRGPQQQWLRRHRGVLLYCPAIIFLLAYGAANVLGYPYYGSATNWVGIFGFTLIDIFAAGLILEATHPGGTINRILSLKLLQSFGTLSYGFYVYHDLLHDFYGYIGHRFSPKEAFPVTITLAFCCSWAIAWSSYRLLELPFLKLKSRLAPHQKHRAPHA